MSIPGDNRLHGEHTDKPHLVNKEEEERPCSSSRA